MLSTDIPRNTIPGNTIPGNTIPGNSTYSNITNHGCIYSDSIVKRTDMVKCGNVCVYKRSQKKHSPDVRLLN